MPRFKDPESGKFISQSEAERRGIQPSIGLNFGESFEQYVNEVAQNENMKPQEVAENILSQEFMIVSFDEATGKASLQFYNDGSAQKAVDAQMKTPEGLAALYKDLRENFAPIAAGVEYHKTFLVGSGFEVITDDPSDKHKLEMRDEIRNFSSKVYFDYYRRGLDKILYILADDLLTYGAIGAEIIYEKDFDFEDFQVQDESSNKMRVQLVQEVTSSQWRKLKGISRLKILDRAYSRLTPVLDEESIEFLYWKLDNKKGESFADSMKREAGLLPNKANDEEDVIKLLPWQVFYIAWNTRGSSLEGQSIIRPVLTLATQVRAILKAVGKGFERWADRKFFFVCGNDKRPWNKQAIANFMKYLSMMIKNKWTGLPVPQGFDVKEIGGDVFEGTDILNYLIGLICAGMNYPRDFLEYGRTNAGDKAWLAWQVKYGSNQRQLRRDIELQLFQKHLWCKFGKTYKVPKQGTPEKKREKADIYIPKIVWHAEGRWQKAEELKSLISTLNVANPIGPELKLAVEMKLAELMGFGEIEFPSFGDIRREMKRQQKLEETMMEEELKLKKRQMAGVSKRIAPTGQNQKSPPPVGSTRNPKTLKKGMPDKSKKFTESVETEESVEEPIQIQRVEVEVIQPEASETGKKLLEKKLKNEEKKKQILEKLDKEIKDGEGGDE
jgi:hypothetical protein